MLHSMTKKSDAVRPQAVDPLAQDKRERQRARALRIELLNDELDKLTVDAAERTASIANRASFLAVSAGVLIAASTAQLWSARAIFGVVALGLGCIALLCATAASRPGKRLGLRAQRLVDTYADADVSGGQLLSAIVRQKADALEFREGDLSNRATWITAGFTVLVVSAAALTAVVSAQLMGW
ncbi:hypothetical protein [Microbacterium sp. NPDC087589]|uniref:hypothetical protein n=1 Tax=Microbacterium sp. NPDC087589 TaxID=3364191 RepID=UPI00381F26D9